MDQTQSRRGRPPRITHDQIAQAVIDVGFPNLTFAAVREKLGVGESTLYRYAPDRDELVRMGLNYAFSQVEMPPLEGHWRDILHSQAVHLWRSFEKYPGSATEAARGVVPAVAMYFLEELCAALIRRGFTPENAVIACDTLFDMVIDNRRGVEHIDALIPDGGPGRENILEQVGQDQPAPHQQDQGQDTDPYREQAQQAILDVFTRDPYDWLICKITIILDGIAQSLAPQQPPDASTLPGDLPAEHSDDTPT